MLNLEFPYARQGTLSVLKEVRYNKELHFYNDLQKLSVRDKGIY